MYYNYKNNKEDYLTLSKLLNGLTSSEFLEKIAALYASNNTRGNADIPENVHPSVIAAANNSDVKYSAIYGEMKPDTMLRLIQYMKAKNITRIVDVGSGFGRIPLTMVSDDTIDMAIGIEIVKDRHDFAKKQLEELRLVYPSFMKRVQLTNTDMFNINFKELSQDKPMLVFTSNLCYPPAVTLALYDKLSKELPIGSIVKSSKCPEKVPANFKHENYKNIHGNIDIVNGKSVMPMTWHDGHEIHVFVIT